MNDPLMDPAGGNNTRPLVEPPLGWRIVDTGYVAVGDKAWNKGTNKWLEITPTKVAVGHPVKDFVAVCRLYVPTDDEVNEVADKVHDLAQRLHNSRGKLRTVASVFGPNKEGAVWASIRLYPEKKTTYPRFNLLELPKIFDEVLSMDFMTAETHESVTVQKGYVRVMAYKNGVLYTLDLYAEPEKK